MHDGEPNASAKTSHDDEAAAGNGAAAFHHINLPKFWWYSPRVWFTHAEAVFASHRVTASSTRVNHVLAALDEDGVRTVADLVGPRTAYDAIRQLFIDAPTSALFRSFVQPGGKGDRRPSQLLRDMREMAPEGIGEAALRELWLLKLPTNVRTVVASLDHPLGTLASRADRLMEAYASRALNQDDRIESLQREVTSLSRQVQALVAAARSQRRGRTSATTLAETASTHNTAAASGL